MGSASRAGTPYRRVVGIGIERRALAENPFLDEWRVQDLNRNPFLPFAASEFTARRLRRDPIPGAAGRGVARHRPRVAARRAADRHVFEPVRRDQGDRVLVPARRNGQLCLVAQHFAEAGNWADIRCLDRTPPGGGQPLYAVIGAASAPSARTERLTGRNRSRRRTGQMAEDRNARIRERAYHIWLEEGQPHGRHDEHWHRAERELIEEENRLRENSAATGARDGAEPGGASRSPPDRRVRIKQKRISRRASPGREAPARRHRRGRIGLGGRLGVSRRQARGYRQTGGMTVERTCRAAAGASSQVASRECLRLANPS